MFLKILIVSCLLAVPLTCFGAIYQYTDDHGVIHFTNILPGGKKYKILVHDSGKSRIPSWSTGNRSFDSKAYDNLIEYHASSKGIDPSLVKAVVKAESNFNPNAVSPKGAQGLMQLMPDTAKLMRIGDPFNPEENIRGGTGYLKMLDELFKGDLELMLAAYNAGPTRVMEHNMRVPPIEETKNFIKRVKQYYNKLRIGNEG
jgi:soluble lytic murein transglycosylase-like protein